jgi:hypothetical protein
VGVVPAFSSGGVHIFEREQVLVFVLLVVVALVVVPVVLVLVMLVLVTLLVALPSVLLVLSEPVLLAPPVALETPLLPAKASCASCERQRARMVQDVIVSRQL